MSAKVKLFGVCKLCGQQKDLRGSHIVPEFCYKSIYDGKHRATKVHVHAKGYIYRAAQRGYTEPLLCDDCERHLNTKYEQPFHKFWYTNVITSHPVTQKYPVIRGFGYDWMKLFHLSVLWRFHVSDSFGSITLGPYADTIKGMLLEGDARTEDYLPVAASLLLDDKKRVMHQIVSEPGVAKFEHSHFYAIQYAGCDWFFLMATTLNSKQAQFFKTFGVRQNGTMRLIAQHYQKSRTYEMILRRMSSASRGRR